MSEVFSSHSVLKGKRVLITGASSGIGEACAEAFAAQGADLILLARREDKLQHLATRLSKPGREIHIAGVDVSNQTELKAQLAHLPKSIDYLINNAGCALGVETLDEGHLSDWNEMIDTNVKGLLHLIRLLLPGMLVRKTGHIINIGSTASHNVYSGGSVYCATKHAVHAITKTLRLETAGKGIYVTEIDPGMTETEFSLVRLKGDAAKAKAVYENMRPLLASDIADAIIYAATRPPHVNIAQILLYSVDQVQKLPS